MITGRLIVYKGEKYNFLLRLWFQWGVPNTTEPVCQPLGTQRTAQPRRVFQVQTGWYIKGLVYVDFYSVVLLSLLIIVG